ncbi:putative peptidoglycan lipid II flippase [Halopolyspora algeriensis]|uniref:Putative peptidoglycan lipid II flippase n=1 Tax=Halopolyspora algeriensis TaxID=1500506 RepID=A0A368VYD6_9ACTN|nr:murein biosynthesis integral membrane protein MurJ [Halopolyspora algeriensis]RCW47216.1 putative peptidoglycan lipid II flippase [Halopolyspora algeriensis]TQM48301.1 putative peptidoglycan lipid II flippase [Halopolyspora algeriensis]
MVHRNGNADPGTSPDAHPATSVRTASSQSRVAFASESLTEPIPAVPDEAVDELATEQTRVLSPVGSDSGPGSRKPSLLKASGSMAIATLVSRITGFGWKLILAYAVGFGVINDSFTVANTLPTSIFELLIGGVLTSVIVPVLVRAQKSDSDGGQAYIQRLLSLATVLLGVGTALSVIAAPVLAAIFVGGSNGATTELTTAFAYLLLPQIFFYGVSALVSAILQSKQVFGPPAWAPVMNNVVILATLGIYTQVPGELTINPVRMTDAHLLTLGVGVTCGIVAQACIQIPAMRKTGFRFRWRWGWDPRLSEFGGLALWMLAYVGVSQIGLIALTKVATAADPGAWAIYNYVWMLLQLPYGVIGFSVMTAILPRMSAAAADQDHQRVIEDLSLGNRLSTVFLLPISALMTALGAPIALALFSVKGGTGSIDQIGTALAVSAFGVLPYAITMMQMRAFYAMKDARTPTLIMVAMTAAKLLMAVTVATVLPPQEVLFGLVFTNSFTFVVGWLIGEVWLRRHLGALGSRRFLITLGKTLTASVAGGALAWLVGAGIDGLIPGSAGAVTGWLQLLIGGTIGLVAVFGAMWALRVTELQPAIGRITGLLHRR